MSEFQTDKPEGTELGVGHPLEELSLQALNHTENYKWRRGQLFGKRKGAEHSA